MDPWPALAIRLCLTPRGENLLYFKRILWVPSLWVIWRLWAPSGAWSPWHRALKKNKQILLFFYMLSKSLGFMAPLRPLESVRDSLGLSLLLRYSEPPLPGVLSPWLFPHKKKSTLTTPFGVQQEPYEWAPRANEHYALFMDMLCKNNKVSISLL